MNIEAWDPYERLYEYRRRSNAVLDQLLSELQNNSPNDGTIGFHPEVDLVETEHEFRFYLSIPGVIEDDLEIDIDGQSLTIRGERQPPYDLLHREAAVQEWRYGFFERRLEFPKMISATNIRANYDCGVLTIVAEKLTSQTSSVDFGIYDGDSIDGEVRP